MRTRGGGAVPVLKAWLVLLVSAGLVTVAAVAALSVPGRLREERDFRAATLCAAAPARPAECRWEEELTVRGTRKVKQGRSDAWLADLATPSGQVWRAVEFRDALPRSLSRGDRLTGVFWRGALVRAKTDGVAHETLDGVTDQGAAWQAGALMTGPVGFFGFVASVWWLAARGERRHRKAARIVGWHGVALSVLAFPCMLIQDNYDWPLWGIWALWGPLALIGLCTMTAFARAALRERSPGEPAPGGRPPLAA